MACKGPRESMPLPDFAIAHGGTRIVVDNATFDNPLLPHALTLPPLLRLLRKLVQIRPSFHQLFQLSLQRLLFFIQLL